MFSPGLFRFRSPERNRVVDNRRFALIQRAVRTALSEAEAEATGLGARVAKARRALIFLSEQVEVESNGGLDLENIERSLLAAEGRLEELGDHIKVLRELEGAVSTHRTDSTGRSGEKEHQL
jgi:hypothetical protein